MKNTGKRIFGLLLLGGVLALAGCGEMTEPLTLEEQVAACEWYQSNIEDNIWGPGHSGLLDYYREQLGWCRAEGYL